MFDIGWSELMVLGALALIVVGPRDLPSLLRSVGQYVGQARSMARDFQRSMDEAAREADLTNMKELRETAQDLNNLKNKPFEKMSGLGETPARATKKRAASAPAAKPPAAPAAKPTTVSARDDATSPAAATPGDAP